MQILSRQDGIYVKKDEGTEVVYHLFHEYEIHYNEVPADTIQHWHHHKKVEETLYIISGQLEAHWKDENSKEFSQIVSTGNLVRVENTPHTFINNSKDKCVFLVFRFVPMGIDNREVMKNDKHLDE